MKLTPLLQSLVVATAVAPTSAILDFFFGDREAGNLAEIADRNGLDTLVNFAYIADEALAPVLARLTGDTPTSKSPRFKFLCGRENSSCLAHDVGSIT